MIALAGLGCRKGGQAHKLAVVVVSLIVAETPYIAAYLARHATGAT